MRMMKASFKKCGSHFPDPAALVRLDERVPFSRPLFLRHQGLPVLLHVATSGFSIFHHSWVSNSLPTFAR